MPTTQQTDPNSLKNIAAQNGLTLGFSNGQVTLTDPNTGKALNFTSGQGQQYGLGGISGAGNNAYNTVSNPTQLLNYFKSTSAPATASTSMAAPVANAQPAAAAPTVQQPFTQASDPNSLKNIAANNGLLVGFQNGQVTVTNPQTGKVINFASGAGQNYGMGGLTGGANNTMAAYNQVTDVNALLKALQGDQPTALQTAVGNFNNGVDQNTQMYNNQRTDERNTVKDVISADNYGKILQNVLQQLMPTYDVSAAKLKDQAAANANAIDIDAEKRGIFNSGAAATLQQNNQKDLTQNLAALLADLQSQSVDQARQYVGQQLEGTGQLGDWTTSDQSAGLDALKSKLAAAFNLDEAELNRTLGLGGLAVDQQNANTNAQNANTNQYNAQTDRMVGLGNLQIDRAKLDESVRQFNLSFQQANEFHADDMKQFAQQMGFNYAQLGSEERRAAASQALQSAGLQLDYAKFNSEQDLIKYQQKMQGLTDYKDAYDMLSQVDAAGAQKGWSADQIYQAKKDLIAPYSAYNSDLYKDLLSGIKTDYEKSTTSPLLSIPASNDLWNKMQGFTSKETYSPLLSKTANLTNSIKNILSK